MELRGEERRILDGDEGEAHRMTLSILVRMGELFDAPRLMPITQAHIDACLYSNDAGLEFAERLAGLGARFRVPTTLNVTARDAARWEAFRIPADWSEKARRMEEAYLAMGGLPTWTCAPYEHGLVPRFGQQVAWGESNAVAFVNTVIGARTNRYADFMDVCAAVAGKVPETGLHTTPGRRGQVLVRLREVPDGLLSHESFYPVLGYLLGPLVGERIPVLEGIPGATPNAYVKSFCAAAASSGSLAMAHVVGLTPEARTLQEAFQGGEPDGVLEIPMGDLRDARRKLSTADLTTVDLIAVGCPHLSLPEAMWVADQFRGKRLARPLEFWISTSRAVRGYLEGSGHLATLEGAGLKVLTDTCAVTTNIRPWGFRTMMTNSAKHAHYCGGQTGLTVVFASLEDCVGYAQGRDALEAERLWGIG